MEKKPAKSLPKIVLSVSGVIFLSKLLAFAKNVVMAGTFGASIETDLIVLSNSLISNMEFIITQTFATALVPIYFSVKGEADGIGKRTFVSNALKLFLLIACVLTLILVIGAPIVAKIIAPTYEGEVSRQLAVYIRLLAPILLFFVLQSLFRALLNAQERFMPGTLVSVISNVLMIACIYLFSLQLGTDTIILGLWLGAVVSAFSVGIISRDYWSIRSGNPFQDADIQALLKMVLPLLFGYSMIFINQQVDKIIVSSMEDGTVTAMHYGNTISQLVLTFISSFCTVMYTRLSVNSMQGQHKQNADSIVSTLSIVITLLLPVTVITLLCSYDITRIIYERKAFNADAARIAAYALAGYGIIFIPFTVKTLFARYLYSNKNSKDPVKNNVTGIVFNIGLSLALFKPLGVFGVTFATSIAELVTGVLNIRASKKINPHLSFQLWKSNAKYWVAGCAFCTASVLLAQRFILSVFSSPFVCFPVCTAIGMLFYSIPCFKLMKKMLNTIRKK